MGVHAANTEGQPTATQKGNGNTEGPRNATSISYTSAYFPRGGPAYLRPYVVSRFLRADSKHADLTHIHAARTSSAHSYKDDVQFQFQSFSSSNHSKRKSLDKSGSERQGRVPLKSIWHRNYPQERFSLAFNTIADRSPPASIKRRRGSVRG